MNPKRLQWTPTGDGSMKNKDMQTALIPKDGLPKTALTQINVLRTASSKVLNQMNGPAPTVLNHQVMISLLDSLLKAHTQLTLGPEPI